VGIRTTLRHVHSLTPTGRHGHDRSPQARARRALAADEGALVLQGDVGLFQIGVALALALALVVFELLGRAFSRREPSKDPNDYRD
jgi:hypothetical protein